MALKHLLQKLEALGHWFFYMTMRIFGPYGLMAARILLVPVILCYVVFSRKINKTIAVYLKHRFPGEPGWKYFSYVFRNVYAFGSILVDRGWLGVNPRVNFDGTFEGLETLSKLIAEGKGVVMITAHVGNWQTAFANLGDLGAKVHAMMQYDQQLVAKHYFDLQGTTPPFEIISVDDDFGGMIDAAAALSRGEIVTIMADRYVKGSSTEVDFLGAKVRLPDAAYVLAAASAAPVVVVLSAKTGVRSYQIKVWDHFYPEYATRDERQPMLKECASRYAKSLEKYLKRYPFQWYNFYNFWKQ
ncbi:lipid A biosynthesis acyltransferase [Desulfosediminicola sp.]|uniref:LpxL/LpxP family acyltransferase n=1 Tax=Desulfosediminicola sp. TaxID=2886825 RepID=UPI003AF2BEC1